MRQPLSQRPIPSVPIDGTAQRRCESFGGNGVSTGVFVFVTRRVGRDCQHSPVLLGQHFHLHVSARDMALFHLGRGLTQNGNLGTA